MPTGFEIGEVPRGRGCWEPSIYVVALQGCEASKVGALNLMLTSIRDYDTAKIIMALLQLMCLQSALHERNEGNHDVYILTPI